MAITNETRHTLKCDNPDCKTEISWVTPLSLVNQPPEKLKQFVITEDAGAPVNPRTGEGHKKMWCSDECALAAIEKNLHRQPTLELAGANEIAKVKRVTIQ